MIVARFVWIFPATYLPRWLVPAIARKDPAPVWQAPFLIGFTGIRGIVSLAAALAIPFATASGAPFPHRDLILFLTFSVIVVTLVGQGLLAAERDPLARPHGDWAAPSDELEAADELASRRQTIEAVMRRLDAARGRAEAARARSSSRCAPITASGCSQLDYRIGADEADQQLARLSDELELRLIEAEREHLYALLCRGELKDDARRRIETRARPARSPPDGGPPRAAGTTSPSFAATPRKTRLRASNCRYWASLARPHGR